MRTMERALWTASMRWVMGVLACCAMLLGAGGAQAQIADKRPLVAATLVAEHKAAKPGSKLTVALREIITPGWHTYWKNPGDSGEPTAIEWKLPAGVAADPIAWPVPELIPVGPLINYGYSGEALLLIDITIPQSFSGPAVTLAANVRWLVCKDICVPEDTTVTLTLPLIDPALSPQDSADAPAIRSARAALPRLPGWQARYEIAGKTVTLKIDRLGEDAVGLSGARFFPENWGEITDAAPQKATFTGGGLTLRMQAGETGLSGGAPLEGVLALESKKPDGEKIRRGYLVQAEAAPATGVGADLSGGAEPAGVGFGLALVFAFLGGLILNLMPCVFPILSLKAYALAREAMIGHRRHLGGIAYTVGVLASFSLIAAGLITLRAAGVAAGWGIQFQSPAFLLVLIALFLALGLNMSGVFDIGGSLAGAGEGLTRKGGLAGSFFTGVLATVVATPCTAPFMGAAIGFAFAQPAAEAIAVLMMLGLGFALPILLLSVSPALGRLLPRPGPWMLRFKQVMAFPLYATAAWLVWVLSVQQGSDGVMAAMVILIATGFAAWLSGLSGSARGLRLGAALAIAAIGLLGAAALLPQAPKISAAEAAGSGPRAEVFTQTRLDELLSQGKPVFVNLTAAWCITCKVNERVALNSERMTKAFADHGVTYLKGDWTAPNPEIAALLQSFGRAGVPLYLLYSGKPASVPEVLPQLLTESIVLGRLAELPSPQKQAKGGM